jgi:hypothetical protein
MRANAWNVWGLIAAGVLAGCGGGSGTGGSGGFSTSVPSGTEVENLTPAQANQLCGDINSYLTKQVDSSSFCQVAAVVATASQATHDTTLTDTQLQRLCSQVTTSVCALLSADGGTVGAADGGASSCGSTSGCTATVAQISACLNDTGTSLSTYEKMFPSCSMVTRANLATVNPDAQPMSPSSCAGLDTSCPNFNPMPALGALGSP